MPFWWPFGRRRRKNKSAKAKSASEKQVAGDSPASPLLDEKRDNLSTPPPRLDPVKLSTPLSQQPLRNDDAPRSQPQTAQTSDFPTENTSLEDITALPVTRKVTHSSQPRSAEASGPRPPPSLHSKKSTNNDAQLSKRKSSKRKNDKSFRESQIKAMSSPIPIPKRHGADARIRAALIEGSAVSLPRAGSTRSSVTALSDNQYEVGGIDVFSPRPTIRHSMYNNQASNAASRTASRTEDRYDKDISPRQVLKESKTIDDLADNYDANTLRELMDRDRRRRERRRKAQEERARKRLERYAETGEPGPSQRTDQPHAPKRGKKAEDTGLGVVDAQAGPSQPQRPTDTVEQPVKETEDLSRRNPFADTESEVITPLEDATVNTAHEIRYSQISASSPPASPIGHSRKRSTVSQTTDPRTSSTTNVADSAADQDRRASETSTRRVGPLSSLFRRSALGRRTSGEPQETMPSERSFSNTSRESMSRQLPPAHMRERPTVPRVRSGTPTRTMSKFREDLPELPSTQPPGSLPQSPEVSEPPEGTVLTARQREKMPEGNLGGDEPSDSRAESPSVAVLSQSLASMDSEGSWLSGRPQKRTSLQSTPLAGVEGRMARGQESKEKIEVPEGQSFGRSEPAQPQQGASGIASALKSADEQAEAGQTEATEERVGEVARRPTVVKQSRTKSSEGLLREFHAGGDESKAASPVQAASPTEDKAEEVESEESGGSESPPKPALVLAHTRSVSRGSAKLLDITRKGSAVSRETQEPPPLPPSGD